MSGSVKKKSAIKKVGCGEQKRKKGGFNIVTSGSEAKGRWMEVVGGDVIYRIDIISTITIPKNILNNNSDREINKLIDKQKLKDKRRDAVYEKMFAALLAVVKFEAKKIPFEEIRTTTEQT